MNISEILRTSDQVLLDGYQIDNEMIRGADISIIGHFKNAVSLNIWTGSCCLIHDYNNTQNLGIILKALVELFDLEDEDGFKFSDMKNIPCRIISKGGLGSKVIGFGHFMKDKFVYTNDLLRLTE